MKKYKKLNSALIGLVEDYSLVSYHLLDIQVTFTFKNFLCCKSNCERTLCVTEQGKCL